MSPARFVRCKASPWRAFSVTVAISWAFGPRLGTWIDTDTPRTCPSQRAIVSASSGTTETSTSRGIAEVGVCATSSTLTAATFAALPAPASSIDAEEYTCSRRRDMSASSPAPSTRSITQPRVPRMRPPRTWKT